MIGFNNIIFHQRYDGKSCDDNKYQIQLSIIDPQYSGLHRSVRLTRALSHQNEHIDNWHDSDRREISGNYGKTVILGYCSSRRGIRL